MEESTTLHSGMTANTLKTIAIIAMLIDHIAWKFVATTSPLGILMHIIGRMTIPIMCYFIAEGFFHTRDVKRYAMRLFLFALISQIPFTYLQTGHLLPQYQGIMESINVIFTLFIGLMALWACKSNLHKNIKVLIAIGCCILVLAADWMFFGVLWILAFGLNRGNVKKQVIWFSVVSIVLVGLSMLMKTTNWFQAGVFLAIPLLYLYNGRRGGYAWSKWMFYIFYPLHMLILGFISFGF